MSKPPCSCSPPGHTLVCVFGREAPLERNEALDAARLRFWLLADYARRNGIPVPELTPSRSSP